MNKVHKDWLDNLMDSCMFAVVAEGVDTKVVGNDKDADIDLGPPNLQPEFFDEPAFSEPPLVAAMARSNPSCPAGTTGTSFSFLAFFSFFSFFSLRSRLRLRPSPMS